MMMQRARQLQWLLWMTWVWTTIGEAQQPDVKDFSHSEQINTWGSFKYGEGRWTRPGTFDLRLGAMVNTWRVNWIFQIPVSIYLSVVCALIRSKHGSAVVNHWIYSSVIVEKTLEYIVQSLWVICPSVLPLKFYSIPPFNYHLDFGVNPRSFTTGDTIWCRSYLFVELFKGFIKIYLVAFQELLHIQHFLQPLNPFQRKAQVYFVSVDFFFLI